MNSAYRIRVFSLRGSLLLIVASLCNSALSATEPGEGDTKHVSDSSADSTSDTTIDESPIMDYDREHWSLQPIVRPPLPQIHSREQARNPIDYFTLAQLEEHALGLSPPAPRRTLLRRLKFDLLGLPPTPAEIAAFEAASDENAYERLVDGYLSSPEYGEHWAQYWLDLARFAETDGFEHDKVRKGSWKYRDWVIEALNHDMSYETFVRMQLCGDQAENSERSRIATQFCMAGPDMPDINEQDLRRHDKLNELTSTVGATMLGLQFQCAQCHDHKYDPISQADFYRLRAIFEPAIPEFQRDRHVLYLEKQDNPIPGRFYRRGDLQGADAVLPPGLPRVACAPDKEFLLPGDNPREEFCNWLFDSNNPLTSRVIANRIWQHHFGRPLAENPNDFGVVAGGPTHPELLDWLASELQSQHWSIKHLHRLIVTSQTYRQAGSRQDGARLTTLNEVDPSNDLLGYYPLRRLRGESIRDAMLSASGLINRQKQGESVFPPLPPELLSTLLKNQWKESESLADHYRRSIYIFARRNLRYPLFEAFDRPDAGATCAIRNRSTTATQSLHMLNSELTLECASALATLVSEQFHSARTSHDELDLLFLRIYGRRPSRSERELIRDIDSGKKGIHSHFTTVAVALFNSNEFLYLE